MEYTLKWYVYGTSVYHTYTALNVGTLGRRWVGEYDDAGADRGNALKQAKEVRGLCSRVQGTKRFRVEG